MNGENLNDHNDPAAPPRLAEALAALHKERVFVPPVVDDAILAPARRHLDRVAQHRARRWVLVPWMAAAAACLVAGAWLSQTLLLQRSATSVPVAGQDVTGDGRVDILDAFALARQIGNAEASQHDVNGDGRVDQQDVEALAARAVKLEGGS